MALLIPRLGVGSVSSSWDREREARAERAQRDREAQESEEGDREAVAEFLGKSVSAETRAAYERYWSEFTAYVEAEEMNKDPLQVTKGSMPRRLLVVIRYCQYLHRSGKRDEQVGNMLRGVRFHLECRVANVDIFSDSIIERAKTACQRTLREALALRDSRETRRKVCVPLEVMLELRRLYWSSVDWSWDNALLRLIWLGLLFGRVTGLRPGNWTLNSKVKRETNRDHNLKTKDLRFLVNSGEGARAGEEVEVHSHDKEALRALTLSRVVGVRYRVTTKTTKGHVGEGGWRHIGAACELDKMFLADVLTYVASDASSSDPEEYFFIVNRVSTKSSKVVAKRYMKVLQSSLAGRALKAVGATMGIPPQNLSLSSVRRAYATVLEASHATRGASATMIDPRSNWTVGSKVPFKHYSQMSSIGKEAAEEICDLGDVTMEHVRRVLGSDLVKVGGAIPDAPKRIGIDSSNPDEPDSEDSSSDSGSEDGDPRALDEELRRLYKGEGKLE